MTEHERVLAAVNTRVGETTGLLTPQLVAEVSVLTGVPDHRIWAHLRQAENDGDLDIVAEPTSAELPWRRRHRSREDGA